MQKKTTYILHSRQNSKWIFISTIPKTKKLLEENRRNSENICKRGLGKEFLEKQKHNHK